MPDERLPERLCQRLSELIARYTGLHFPPERYLDLQRAMTTAAEEFGFPDSAECARWLLATPLSKAQLNTLASHLTVGETYFFREPLAFEALSQHLLPELLHGRRGREQRLRLWSAACCTGEEAYSLAILTEQLLGEASGWHITILATDINEQFLRRAIAGSYGEWSFRNAPAGLKERYFTRSADGRWLVRPEIKRRVSFQHLNLARDVYPSLETDTAAMDVIFCRNALMYFTPAQIRKVIARLRCTLVDGGTLIVGATECSHTLFTQFRGETFAGLTVYRKAEQSGALEPTSALESHAALEPYISLEPRLDSPSLDPPRPTNALRLDQPRPADALQLSATPAPDMPTAPNPETLAARAHDLANQGRLPEALASSELWIAADKTNFAAHYLHAMILQEMGNPAAARHSLNRTLYLKPDFALGYFALGNLARATRREAEAEKHFQNALHTLHRLPPSELLAETDGMTAGGLAQVINTLLTLSNSEHAREHIST